ncbi:MAG TPA: exodeoxyribonuclease VII small subunit [Candidatus Dormibacteraeota bacterium]|nr:exodeoxyribonuclease VII small subunit [Candidatus Dormibacteraeota bacterium]
MATDADASSLTYEEALAELETLISRLERGDVDLEEAVACYQRGSALAQRCTALLDRTEAAVVQLVVAAGGVEEERPFSPLVQPGPDDRAPAGATVPPRVAPADRLRVPPPPGSPARARAVPGEARVAPPPLRPQETRQPVPARPAPSGPELFPAVEQPPGTDPPDVDFDLDDIPF